MSFVASIMNALTEATMDFMIQDPANAKKHCKAGFEALWRAIAYGQKLRLLKGGSVPTFLVLGRCCTTSLPWTLEQVRRGSQAILGYRRLVQQFQCSMAVLELLARATEAWVVAAGNEHLVNRSSLGRRALEAASFA